MSIVAAGGTRPSGQGGERVGRGRVPGRGASPRTRGGSRGDSRSWATARGSASSPASSRRRRWSCTRLPTASRSPIAPDWSFSPSVGGFNPDAQYKAPAHPRPGGSGGLRNRARPRRPSPRGARALPHALELDVPGGPLLSVGFMPARLTSHSVYGEDTGRTWKASAPAGERLLPARDGNRRAGPGLSAGRAVPLGALRAGRAGAGGRPAGGHERRRFQGLALWDDWRRRVWDELSPREWLTVPLPDGSVGGGVRTDRWGGGPSVYLGSWFNTLRTSYGMALYARRDAAPRAARPRVADRAAGPARARAGTAPSSASPCLARTGPR